MCTITNRRYCSSFNRLSLLTLAAMVLFTNLASVYAGNTFYVDPVRGSMAYDGSFERPWRTLQEVFQNNLIETRYENGNIRNAGAPVKAGDTILLRSGNHGEVVYGNAYNTQYIIVAADEGEQPKLSHLELNGVARWIFRGLTISPYFAPNFERQTMVEIFSRFSAGQSYDVVIENCFLYTVLDSSTWTVSDWNNLSCNGINFDREGYDLIARNNHLLNVNFAISLQAENSLAEGNIIENFSGDGIRAVNHGVTARHNIIKNCYDVNANHDDGIQGFLTNVGPGEVMDVTLTGNIIINRSDPDQPHPGTMQGIGCFDGPFTRWRVENNVIMTDHWHGITIYLAGGCEVVNNTAFNKRYHDGQSTRYSWIDISGGVDEDSANTIRNNIAQRYTLAGWRHTSNNLTISPNADADLWFTDYRNDDLSLVETCPAIDAGTEDDAPEYDVTMKRRPFGENWDVGAYEYGILTGSTVTARHLFYNNSAFDGNDPAPGESDDNAIATDKQLLLPGQQATFKNYSCYSRGINGIMIDIPSVPGPVSVSDFEFTQGNTNWPDDWEPAPLPTHIAVRTGAGIDGSDRVTLIWTDGSIRKKWLKVLIKAGNNIGLAQDDIFYVGNAVGDTGDQSANAIVDTADQINCRNNPRHFLRPAAVDNPYDHNRDGKVDSTDEIISRSNTTNFNNALILLSPPAQ